MKMHLVAVRVVFFHVGSAVWHWHGGALFMSLLELLVADMATLTCEAFAGRRTGFAPLRSTGLATRSPSATPPGEEATAPTTRSAKAAPVTGATIIAGEEDVPVAKGSGAALCSSGGS